MSQPILKFLVPQAVVAPRGAVWAALAAAWIARHLATDAPGARP